MFCLRERFSNLTWQSWYTTRVPNLNSNFLLPAYCPGAISYVHQRQLNQSTEEIRRLGIIFELEGRKFFSGFHARNESIIYYLIYPLLVVFLSFRDVFMEMSWESWRHQHLNLLVDQSEINILPGEHLEYLLSGGWKTETEWRRGTRRDAIAGSLPQQVSAVRAERSSVPARRPLGCSEGAGPGCQSWEEEELGLLFSCLLPACPGCHTVCSYYYHLSSRIISININFP